MTQDKGWVQQLQSTRHLIPPKLTASGELGLITAAVLISVAYLLVGQATDAVSLMGAIAFAGAAIPASILMLFVCGHFFRTLSIAAGLFLVVASISAVVVLAHLLQVQYFGQPENPQALLLRRILFANLLVAYLLRQSFLQYRLKRRKDSEQSAKIQALQSRIRPHFLFNSMNVIASLIPVDPEAAERVVEDLSELFRASLQQAGSVVRVSQELELCRRYLHIEQLRLGDRMQVDWQVETPPGGAEMPLLILQPLLENAIYHGIQPLPEGGTIRVEVRFTADEMRAQITNPLIDPARSHRDGDGSPGQPKSPHKGNSIAIDNIRQRLSMVYGENANLFTTQEGNQFTTWLNCPTVAKML